MAKEIQKPTGKQNIDNLIVLTAVEKASKFFSKIRLSLNQPLDDASPNR